MMPKVLSVNKGCQCNSMVHPTLSDSDVLIVLTITKSKQLLVRNVSRSVIFELPKRCSASFTTDPNQACIPIQNLELFMSLESLHGVPIFSKEGLDMKFWDLHHACQLNSALLKTAYEYK